MSNFSRDPSLLSQIAHYTEILSKDTHSTAFVPLSEAYRQMGLLDDAFEVAEKGVNALPQFFPGYVTLGRILFERGDIPAAVAAFETAYAIDPASIPVIKDLARSLSHLGHHARAREILEKGAVTDPNNAAIKKMLAALPSPSGQSPLKLQSESNRAKEPIATSTIAEIYLKQGFPTRALKVYRDLLVSHPDNLELQQKIAVISTLVHEGAEPAEKGGESPPQEIQQTNPIENILSPRAEEFPVISPIVAASLGTRADNLAGRQVELLGCWLAAIRDRRQHVLQ